MTDIEPGEIVYCNLTVATIPKARKKAVVHLFKKVIFGLPYSPPWDNMLHANDRADSMILMRFGISEDVIVTGIEVMVRCGFKNK